jgi:hypothetical protein
MYRDRLYEVFVLEHTGTVRPHINSLPTAQILLEIVALLGNFFLCRAYYCLLHNTIVSDKCMI